MLQECSDAALAFLVVVLSAGLGDLWHQPYRNRTDASGHSAGQCRVLWVLLAILAPALPACSTPTAPTPAGTTLISACQVITLPGAYMLSRDLQQGTSTACLQLSTVTNLRLDCGGHVVPSLSLTNTNTVTISNCVVTSRVTMTGVNTVDLINGTLTGGLSVVGGSSVVVSGTTISAPSESSAVNVMGGTNDQLLQDTITIKTGSFAEAVLLTGGTNNQVLQSTITGGYDGSAAEVGTDDGIVLTNETGDTVQGNTISAFWDTAVEGVDVVANTTVANNTFSNIGMAGVGAYWCTNWTGNVIRGNDVSKAPFLLYVTYGVGTVQCGATEPSAVFSGNQFIGNRFSLPVAGTANRTIAPRMLVSLLSGTVSGNLVQANDLGENVGPYFFPLQGFIDGGGNICAPPQDSSLSNFTCTGGAVTVAHTWRGIHGGHR
jgi:hypothetical protein